MFSVTNKRSSVWFSSILFALLASACASIPQSPVTADDPCIGPELALGRSEESVTDALGEPAARRARTLQNRHDPNVTDMRITLIYTGAEVELHTVPVHDATFLARVEISSDRYAIIPGLEVGMPRTQALRALGLYSDADTVRKECPLELSPTIELTFERGRLARIVWINEPD